MIDASGGVLDQDYEMFEHMTPHLLVKHEYLTDSGGAGKYRGGLGVETLYKVGNDGTQIVTFGDGDVEPAFGLFGGREGTLNAIELHCPDGQVTRTTSKDLVQNVPAGTLYVQRAGGGGGYGPPEERPVRKVQDEVQDEIISIQAARDRYRVALDPETLEILEEKTARLRRADR
jgi:N-methylhydantoinase B